MGNYNWITSPVENNLVLEKYKIEKELGKKWQ